MTDFAIELRAIDALKPYERNARMHPRSQLDQIKASIRRFGFTNPLLIDGEGVIAGHGRMMAAGELWDAGEVIHGPGKRFELPKGQLPTIDASGMDEVERRAYILADNQIAANADWDISLIDLEIQTLQDSGFDIGLIGFSDAELNAFALDREYGEMDTRAEWAGMPGFENPDNCHRKIIVSFEKAEDVEAFAKALNIQISDRTKSIWYPPKPDRNLEGKRWVDGED